jgi:hypothetical protein
MILTLYNVTPADVYYGRDFEILERYEQIKKKMLLRRKQNCTLRLAEKAGKVYMGAEHSLSFLIQFAQNHLKTYTEVHGAAGS